MRRAHAVHPIAAMQTEYSLWSRNAEIAVFDACAELGIGFVAFSPLGRGLLAGEVFGRFASGDIRAEMPRFVEPNLSRNLALYEKLSKLAVSVGCTPAQLCLRWLLAQRDFIVPIPGTTSRAHLDQNLSALSVAMSPTVLEALDRIFRFEAVSGARYAASAQSQIDTETFPGEAIPG